MGNKNDGLDKLSDTASVDDFSESALIALRLIDKLTNKILLLPNEQKHLDLLWRIIELQTYPVRIIGIVEAQPLTTKEEE